MEILEISLSSKTGKFSNENYMPLFDRVWYVSVSVSMYICESNLNFHYHFDLIPLSFPDPVVLPVVYAVKHIAVPSINFRLMLKCLYQSLKLYFNFF